MSDGLAKNDPDKLMPGQLQEMLEELQLKQQEPQEPQGMNQPKVQQSESKVETEKKPDLERLPLTRNTNVRLDEDTYRRLKNYGKRKGMLDSAAIRMFIIKGLDAEGV